MADTEVGFPHVCWIEHSSLQMPACTATRNEPYLIERQISSTEVAYLLGFAHTGAFARAFKRWTGSSPRAYRRARRYGGWDNHLPEPDWRPQEPLLRASRVGESGHTDAL